MANKGTVSLVTDGAQTGWLKVHVWGYDDGAAACMGSIANPEGCLLQITRGFMRVRRDCDAAATLDIGIGAFEADSSDIVSAIDINGAAHDDIINLVGTDLASEAAATTPKGVKWPATSYMNFTNPAAANPKNFDGYCYFQYIRMEEATLA